MRSDGHITNVLSDQLACKNGRNSLTAPCTESSRTSFRACICRSRAQHVGMGFSAQMNDHMDEPAATEIKPGVILTQFSVTCNGNNNSKYQSSRRRTQSPEVQRAIMLCSTGMY